SGGTIQKTTGDGISLANTTSPSFTNVTIQNTGGSGIKGSQVTNFTFINGTITGSGDAVFESNLAFNDSAAGNGTERSVSGNLTVTRNTFTTAFDSGLDIRQGNGTLSSVTVSNNMFTSTTSTTTSRGSAILISLVGTASTVANLTQATISSNTISNFPSGAGIKVLGGNLNRGGTAATLGTPGGSAISITNNSVAGASVANLLGTNAVETNVSGKGQGNFNISNNGNSGNPMTNFAGVGIGCASFGLANVTCTINNNWIVANNTVNSSGMAVGADCTFDCTIYTDTPTLNAVITNNHVSGMQGNGILSGVRLSRGTANLKIQNNVIGAPTAGARPGIRVESGSPVTPATDATVCLNISNNMSAGSGGVEGIGLRKEGTDPSVNTFGIHGMSATSSPGIETYVNGLNSSGGGTLLISATSGFTNCSLP
ncbi:MAG: large repetitive protein, partial [Thermomicrobiales bacterium]|nr:large repetitive protein [Thermomicrobiales bacterium]